MYPVISFDLDGTLMKPGFGDSVWMDGLPRIYAEQNQISLDKAKSYFKQKYDSIGSDNREWYDLSYWIQKYHLPITPNELLDQYEDSIEIFEDVGEILNSLSKKHTLIISSGAMREFIIKELEYTVISHYFCHLFSSTTDTNTVKKDPAFYTMIAQTLGCSPQEIIHIGDNIEYDYYSPKSAGFHAYLLDRTQKSNQPHILFSLKEFVTLLRKDHIK